MRRSFALGVFLLVLSSLPLVAADPPALGPDAVRALPDDWTAGWLTREREVDAKKRLERLAGNTAWRWDGDTLVISCGLQGPAMDMPAVEVRSDGGGVTIAFGGAPMFADLAARSGHTKQEADVLARRYARLAKAFFRTVADPEGGEIAEDELILRHQRKALGIPAEEADEDVAQVSDKQADKLAKAIEAAENRGDMAEVMRLATEAAAQARTAESVARGEEVTTKAYQQRWLLLESSIGQLTDAAYATLVVKRSCPCLQVRWPE